MTSQAAVTDGSTEAVTFDGAVAVDAADGGEAASPAAPRGHGLIADHRHVHEVVPAGLLEQALAQPRRPRLEQYLQRPDGEQQRRQPLSVAEDGVAEDRHHARGCGRG